MSLKLVSLKPWTPRANPPVVTYYDQGATKGLSPAPIPHVDYKHPEKFYKGLVHLTADNWPEVKADLEKKGGIRNKLSDGGRVELCRSCGFSTNNECYSGYGSRVRIFLTRGNKGMWSIGTQWLLRDEPNDPTLGNDYITQKFIREQPTLSIPLLAEMRLLNDPNDKIWFTLMSRAQGVTLLSIFPTLSKSQKTALAGQIADCIKQMRTVTRPFPQKVDGTLLDDLVLSTCIPHRSPSCFQIPPTTEEWFKNMEEQLRRGIAFKHDTWDSEIIEPELQKLKDGFPQNDPCVLSHSNLKMDDIIIKDGRIEAIIDWERAGFYPWWVERRFSGMDDPSSDNIFDEVWEILEPGPADSFGKLVGSYFDMVEAWDHGDGSVDHHNWNDHWLRPPFSDSEPCGGQIRDVRDLGERPVHTLRPRDPNPQIGYGTHWF